MSEGSDMATCGLLFQWASTIQSNSLCWSSTKRNFISLKINLFSPWHSWTIAELALSNNHSLLFTHTFPVMRLVAFSEKPLCLTYALTATTCADGVSPALDDASFPWVEIEGPLSREDESVLHTTVWEQETKIVLTSAIRFWLPGTCRTVNTL